MADADDDNSPDDTHDDDELASKLARLTEEQRTRYQTHVHNAIEQNAEVSEQYRLKLAGTLLKGLPTLQESWDISELNRRERDEAYLRDQRHDQERAKLTASPGHEPAEPARDAAHPAAAAQPKLDNPMEGVRPNASPRDYSELQRTHERLAEHMKQAGAGRITPEPPGQAAELAAAIFSKEQLLLIIEHFPDIRREANLLTGQPEIRERDELARAQNTDRWELEKTLGSEPDPQELEKLDLLERQHLAEQVGVQAKWIAQQLKAQHAPDADQYSRDSRRAFQTARVIHEQRQKLGASIERAQDAEPVLQADQQSTQSADEAVRAGNVLTSEQRANASPETRATIDRKERADAAREVTNGGKDQSAQQGPAKPGNSRGGGRSR